MGGKKWVECHFNVRMMFSYSTSFPLVSMPNVQPCPNSTRVALTGTAIVFGRFPPLSLKTQFIKHTKKKRQIPVLYGFPLEILLPSFMFIPNYGLIGAPVGHRRRREREKKCSSKIKSSPLLKKMPASYYYFLSRCSRRPFGSTSASAGLQNPE